MKIFLVHLDIGILQAQYRSTYIMKIFIVREAEVMDSIGKVTHFSHGP